MKKNSFSRLEERQNPIISFDVFSSISFISNSGDQISISNEQIPVFWFGKRIILIEVKKNVMQRVRKFFSAYGDDGKCAK